MLPGSLLDPQLHPDVGRVLQAYQGAVHDDCVVVARGAAALGQLYDGTPPVDVPPPVADMQGGISTLLPVNAQHGDYDQPQQQHHYLQHMEVQLGHLPVALLHNPDPVEKALLVAGL